MSSFSLYILSIIFLIISSHKNPGFIKCEDIALTVINIQDLLLKHSLESICVMCRIKRNLDTYHCIYCKRCVNVAYI